VALVKVDPPLLRGMTKEAGMTSKETRPGLRRGTATVTVVALERKEGIRTASARSESAPSVLSRCARRPSASQCLSTKSRLLRAA